MFKRAALAFLGSVIFLSCERASDPVVEAAQALLHDVSAPAPRLVPPVPTPVEPVEPIEPPSLCNEQAPQRFLVEAHLDSFLANGGGQREWTQVLNRAVRYRTEQYGYVKGYGKPSWNARTPAAQATVMTFFGVPVSIHRRVAPAVSCVEAALRARCADHPYQPRILSGHRPRNTYFGGEISNHVYGIALDVDPTRNPCCGCIGEWRTRTRCQNGKNKFERMAMPRCWVDQFERFGFYWLGHAPIEDTMHFEFLGDPSAVLRGGEPP